MWNLSRGWRFDFCCVPTNIRTSTPPKFNVAPAKWLLKTNYSFCKRPIFRGKLLNFASVCLLSSQRFWVVSQNFLGRNFLDGGYGGNSNIFGIFTPIILGKVDPVWQAYVSNGLVQPPTSSYRYRWITYTTCSYVYRDYFISQKTYTSLFKPTSMTCRSKKNLRKCALGILHHRYGWLLVGESQIFFRNFWWGWKPGRRW